jgi:hypothetical protein
MQKQDLSKDMENELTIMRLKRYLHSTSFVKTADYKKLPTYFAIGKEVEDTLHRRGKKAKGTIFDQF